MENILSNDRSVEFIGKKKKGKIENWRKHSYYFPRKITKPFSRAKIHFLLVIFHFAFSTNGLSFGPTNIRAIFYFNFIFNFVLLFFFLSSRIENSRMNTLFIHSNEPREILRKILLFFFSFVWFYLFHPDEIVRTF